MSRSECTNNSINECVRQKIAIYDEKLFRNSTLKYENETLYIDVPYIRSDVTVSHLLKKIILYFYLIALQKMIQVNQLA